METIEQINPRIYPIGKHIRPHAVTVEMREDYLQRLETLPARLRAICEQINEKQLASSYRDDGWTAKQIIHHLADSHCNMYIRVKLALTSENPTINPYDENQWADFEEAKNGNIQIPLLMIEVLHSRLVATLRSIDAEKFQCVYTHPQYQIKSTIDQVLALYAWHGDHHLGQIEVILND